MRRRAMHSLTPISRFATALAVYSVVALVLVGCTGGGESPEDATGTTVDVTLQEWAVLPNPSSVSAGEITFTITNEGPEDVHEFVVVQTDLDPADLPTDETGAVTETGEGMTVVDEVEDIPVGETEDLTVSLDPGNYVLICNIYSEDEDEAHYTMGMYTAFTVNE
jgi:uncharacterized cupredoxin-like copper-binding protein